ncbi:MAG: DUF1643 domain-containing protein [Bacteroidota bacterium]
MDLTQVQGAIFSNSGKERYVLWRTWEPMLSRVLFIGLNPSQAGVDTEDATTKRLRRHAQRFGFGGYVLMNCFSAIVTNSKDLKTFGDWPRNVAYLNQVIPHCNTVVFAWGKHPLVKQEGRDIYFKKRFPSAMQLGINKDGSPKHPLYLPYNITLNLMP